MGLNLTVVLGAGAAVDVVHVTEPDRNSEEIKDHRLRPPTVATLFKYIDGWEHNYNLFSGVETTIGDLRNTMAVSPGSTSVETFLSKLKNSSDDFKRKQFRHFPVFLQFFFWHVGKDYCYHPSNYLSLMNQTLTDKFSHVAYVTLNYDLLFDIALQKHPETKLVPNSFNNYTDNTKWQYFKLHGSVNWGRTIDKNFISNQGATLDALLGNIDSIGDRLDQSLGNWVIDTSYLEIDQNRKMIYPAISVPTGESKLNCPDDHVNKLKDQLNHCSNFLIIGYSGFDKDLLELLDHKQNGFDKVLIVSSSEESASNVRGKFMAHDGLKSKLQGHVDIYSGNGFDEFVRSSDGLTKFLDSLK